MDVLVNNAGTFGMKPFTDYTVEELDGYLGYLRGTFVLSQVAVRQMRKQGESPRQNRAIVDSLTRQVERLMIDEKKTEAEITEMFRKGEIRP